MSEPLPLTLCLLVAGVDAAMPDSVGALADVAAEVVIGDGSEGAGVAALATFTATREAQVVTLTGTLESADNVNQLARMATQPWVLHLPAGMCPEASVVLWLQENLESLTPGAYQGIFHDTEYGPGYQRACLFSHGLLWRSFQDGTLYGTDGEDVLVSVLPQLRFRSPAGSAGSGMDPVAAQAEIGRLQHIMALHPLTVRARYELAEHYRAMRRYGEAYQVLLEAWHNPEVRLRWAPAELPALLASVAWECGDRVSAHEFAREAVIVDPTHVGAWEVLVRHRFETDGAAAALGEASSWWEACLSGSPTSCRMLFEAPHLFATACRHIVWSLVAGSYFQEAIAIAELDEAPHDGLIHISLVRGELDRAVELYCRQQRDPDAARDYWCATVVRFAAMPELVTGMIWGSLNGNYYRQLALGCFDLVIAAHPSSAEGYWRRALVLSGRSSDLTKAKADLYRALRIDASRPQIWRKLGDVCHLIGDVVGAAAAYREATRLTPKKRGLF